MSKLPVLHRATEIRLGKDPELEAWLYHFLMENNLEYMLNPSVVASPEQLRFMVALDDDQVYLPCSDAVFLDIYEGGFSPALRKQYMDGWRFIVSLARTYAMSEAEYHRVLSMCRYRFRMFYTNKVLLPSRMIKRLLGIVLTQCGDPDPFRIRKQQANRLASESIARPDFRAIMERCPGLEEASCQTIPGLRRKLEVTELSRLMALSTHAGFWRNPEHMPPLEELASQIPASCLDELGDALGGEPDGPKRILFIPDSAGAFMLDVEFAKALLRQGHDVIISLKAAFYFDTPSMADLEEDDLLKSALSEAHVLHQDQITKNRLLQLLREYHFLVISDGTSELLNLYRTNVTFARSWKECDLIIAKGKRNRDVLLGTSHLFTRKVLCCWRDDDGTFHMRLKRPATGAGRVSEKYILGRARTIVRQMREARDQGKSVMFYSAIIGSIPGQTGLAIQVVTAFVEYLREQLDQTFIINPAEHFEEGMDGDDLMYMWEYVQRSGLLDVWRFQTFQDIEMSFSLLGMKIPAAWSGKDSTFSTGCTKEMRIALDEQKKHPELQIIGPAPERFFRRRDYGIGKYFDSSLKA